MSTVVVAAIWCVDGQLVLVRRGRGAAGHWALPGGAVEPGETLAEAVVRNVEADTGAVAVCGPFVGWSELLSDDRHQVTMYFDAVATAPLDAGSADPVITDDDLDRPDGGAVEVRAYDAWEVTEIPLVEGLAEFLADHHLIELVI